MRDVGVNEWNLDGAMTSHLQILPSLELAGVGILLVKISR